MHVSFSKSWDRHLFRSPIICRHLSLSEIRSFCKFLLLSQNWHKCRRIPQNARLTYCEQSGANFKTVSFFLFIWKIFLSSNFPNFLTNAIFSLQIDETPIKWCNASSQVDTYFHPLVWNSWILPIFVEKSEWRLTNCTAATEKRKAKTYQYSVEKHWRTLDCCQATNVVVVGDAKRMRKNGRNQSFGPRREKKNAAAAFGLLLY